MSRGTMTEAARRLLMQFVSVRGLGNLSSASRVPVERVAESHVC